ncbi:hypothetical protein BTHERMOSOX_140 [Bathymodiolus thermophilus thioautotrophic gill symbiont]|nr:hypothetical protein BTHERMOSOX_140 [Bathymodiolus thermophilus thioautotrophic gill symbiont]
MEPFIDAEASFFNLVIRIMPTMSFLSNALILPDIGLSNKMFCNKPCITSKAVF